MVIYHQTKFGCQGINGSENSRKSHILIISALTVTLTLKTATTTKLSTWHSGSWCCITYQIWSQNVLWFRKYHRDKHSLTFWTFAVNLTLNTVIPFFNRTVWLMTLYYQTKSGCKPTSSWDDTAEIIIFWLYKHSLWPSHWTQWTTFSAGHSGLWCCITIPGLVTKSSVVQKISSWQTFINILNLHCDLDCRNPIFPRDTPAYDAVLLNQIWLQTDQQFRRYSKNSHILII